MLANLLIGLREGLEAALVIGILVAYLVKSDRRDMLRWVWSGVGAAIAVSVGIWALITFTANGMDDEGQEIFAGALSLGAVALVTWMILWMRTAARTLRADLGGKLDKALIAGPAAVLATSFLAVAREGVETALFLWSSMRASGNTVPGALGAVLGLGAAVGLGFLIYRGALRVNLATFFTWTGVALIAVAAWVLAYGVEELADAGAIPEVEWLIPVLAVGYAAVMAYLFFRRGSARPPTLARAAAPGAVGH